MIRSKQELKDFLSRDALATGRSSVKPKLFGDEIWKFQISLRKLDYYQSKTGVSRYFTAPLRIYHKTRFHRLSIKLGYSIPINVFDKGLSIVHRGTIVVANATKIGQNCRIHEGVTIGATNGSDGAATIGNNVFIGSGAKIIGEVTIADDVAIAANAVVTKSILEKGTTWGGVPAKKISDNDSHSNLNKALFPNASLDKSAFEEQA